MDLKQIAASIPDYKAFLTVDEMYASTHTLAAEFPDLVTVREVGKTRRGDPIELISIGSRENTPNAFVFGGPHPNEPIGCMMVEFLTRHLCENPALRAELGYNWHFIKSIDSDGMRLNEGWFKGPFSPLLNYHRAFYRPPSHEQVEWSFPIDYQTLHFDRPLPETRALMEAIDTLQPRFMYSLHNAEFGGVYYYISRPSEQLHELFGEIPGWFDLALDLGEPEVPYAVVYAPAVYQLPAVTANYDFMQANGLPDPATVMTGGASSFEYASRYDTFTLVVEMPYWDAPAVNDLTETDRLRRDVILQKLDTMEAFSGWLRENLDRVKDDLRLDTPFHRAVTEGLRSFGGMIVTQRQWAQTAEETNRPAVAAEVFSNLRAWPAILQRFRGMFARMLAAEIEAGGDSAVLRDTYEIARRALEEEGARLESGMEYRVLPIRSLVAVQLCAGLAAADYARDH